MLPVKFRPDHETSGTGRTDEAETRGFTDRHSWIPGWFSDPREGMATLYDENYQPKRAYNTVKADLVYTGPPYVLPRIPQQPHR